MSKKIVLDAGHGYNTPGKRTPKDVREWTLNDAVCRCAIAALAEYDVEVLRSDDVTGNTDVPLQTRTNMINSVNADLSVSVHHNAITGTWGTWTGVEVYFHKSKPSRDADLAKLFVDEISKLTGLKNRGQKNDLDLHMIRETKPTIPSVLCEGGFMDSTIDEPVITSAAGQKEYGQAVANVCISFLKLQKKPYTPPEPPPQTGIMGRNLLAAEQMSAFLTDKNNTPLIGCTVTELANLYLSESNIEGVRGDIAFAQAMLETGYFKYGGEVLPEQNNYCGLGSADTGDSAWFDTPQVGVRAHIQHLKAYACKDALQYACVDPRFNFVTRGIAPNWTDLNGKWAVPGTDYGEKILAIYDNMSAFDIPVVQEKYYKVQVGAFAVQDNAVQLMDQVKEAGFDAYIKQPCGDDELYRVQVGAFSVKDNADTLAAELKAAGFSVLIKYE